MQHIVQRVHAANYQAHCAQYEQEWLQAENEAHLRREKEKTQA